MNKTHIFGQLGISTSKHQNSWLLLRNEHVEKSGEISIGLEPIKVALIILSRVWSTKWDHDRANWCISDGPWISFIPDFTFKKDKWMRPGIKSIFSQRGVTHQYSLVPYSSFLIGNRSSGIVGHEWCWNECPTQSLLQVQPTVPGRHQKNVVFANADLDQKHETDLII